MSALIRTDLSAQSVQLRTGEKADLTLRVQNMSEIVDRYRITVEGVEPDWVSLSRSELSLFPKDEDKVRITLALPEGSAARAGSYELRVQVASAENPAERTTVPLALEVVAQVSLEATLRPQMQSVPLEGVFSLQLSNQGNRDLTVELAASDPEEGCTYLFNPPQVVLPAGQERLVQLTVRPKLPLPGRTGKLYAFTVVARPTEAPKQAVQAQGQLQQIVRQGRRIWPIIVAALVGLLAVATVLLVLLRPAWLFGQLAGPIPTEVAQVVPTGTPPPTGVPTRIPTAVPSRTPSAVPTRTPTIGIRRATLPVVVLPTRQVLPIVPKVRLDLLANAEQAVWITEQGEIIPFGLEYDERGYVLYRNDVTMEDGKTYPVVLETHPRWVNDGWIQGFFDSMPYVIQTGDELVVTVGFRSGAEQTSGVRFRVVGGFSSGLAAVPPSGKEVLAGIASADELAWHAVPESSIGTFAPLFPSPVAGGAAIPLAGGMAVLFEAIETYDGNLTSARIPLDTWVGYSATFGLQVEALGDPAADWATWVVARVER